MATQVQWRGGSTAEHATFTGAAREVTVDTQKQTLVLHDGSTAGGRALLREDGSNAALALGTASTPSLKFTGDTNTGIYSPGADQLALSTNGTGRLFVDANGRVGIGTTPVSGKSLAVNGNVQFGDGGGFDMNANGTRWQFSLAGTEYMRLDSSGRLGIGTSTPDAKLDCEGEALIGTASYQLQITNSVGNSSTILCSPQTNNLELRARINDYNQLFLASGGNVGIGSTPSYKLDVNTGTNDRVRIVDSASATLELERTSAKSYLIQSTGDSGLRVYDEDAGSERLRVDTSGRLLVGTSNSNAGEHKLQIEGNANSTASNGGIALRRGQTNPAANEWLGQISFTDAAGSEGAYITGEVDGSNWAASDYPTRLVFSTTADGASSPTERMRISSNGFVYFGQSVSTAPGVGNTTVGGCFQEGQALHISRSAGSSLTLNRNTSDGGVARFYRDGVDVGNISVTSTATAYNTSSDYRLKENVTPVTDGITRLQQLKPSRFNFIADPDKTVDGFLAHEVQTIVPEAITGEKDAVDDEGNPQYQGIDQSKLVPLLTAALQEAIGRIETLEAEVAALKAS